MSQSMATVKDELNILDLACSYYKYFLLDKKKLHPPVDTKWSSCFYSAHRVKLPQEGSVTKSTRLSKF